MKVGATAGGPAQVAHDPSCRGIARSTIGLRARFAPSLKYRRLQALAESQDLLVSPSR